MPLNSKKRFIFSLSGWSILCLLLGSSVYAQGVANWPMFRQNPEHSGRTSQPGTIAPDLAWEYNTSGFTYSSPAITGDRAYIASQNALTALDLLGNELWSYSFAGFDTPPSINIGGLISSPAVAPNGTIYIGSLDDMLYAINPNGTLKWTFDAEDQVFSSPVIGPDGTIYFGSRSKAVFAVDPNGFEKWRVTTSGEVLSSPALSANGILYIGSTDGQLYALNTNNNGAVLWTYPVGSEIISSPAIGPDGAVYFGTIDNRIHAVNATGAAKWPAVQTDGEIISSPAVGADQTVYVGSFDGNLYAINGTNGAMKWSWTPPGPVQPIASSPAIDSNNYIYIGSLNGSLYALFDAGNEAVELWDYPLGASVWASPAIGASNRVYVAATGSQSQAGRFVALGQAAYRVVFSPDTPPANQDASVSILRSSDSNPASGTFYYRRAGDLGFESTQFNGNVTIPGTSVTGRGLEYYVEGPLGTFPTLSPQSKPASQVVSIASDVSPLAFQPRIYKMISVPYQLSDPSADAVVADDYGEYGPMYWRLHRWNGQNYSEYPDLGHDFAPGKAFFLITTTGEAFNVPPGRSIDTSKPFPITLKPGWNQIGNPFGFRIPWAQVERAGAIAYFDGEQMIQDPDSLLTFDPWEGYFMLNASEEDIDIKVNPAPISEIAGKQAASAARLQIVAELPEAGLSDSQNWIGFAEEALDGIDALDMREAPPFGDYVRLSIVEDDKAYALNYKPWSDAGQVWTLELTSSLPQTILNGQVIELSFAMSKDFPKNVDLLLVDDDFGYARKISDEGFRMTWDSGYPVRRFRIMAGQNNMAEMLNDVPIAPDQTELAPNYPNPFSESTTIRYRLADRTDVTLRVYNVLGQIVHTLVRGVQSPGVYEVSWDGRDSAGHPAGSGIYICRMQADDFSATGKMILTR